MISLLIRPRAKSQEFHIMLRTLFSLKCMTTRLGCIYIYSFLFSVHLIKCKTKKYHTVGTILISHILNDLEQLLEHT
jgi:hypothetical protein